MKRSAMVLGILTALACAAQGNVIVTEVVHGDLAGGNPKFVELTNCGTAPVTFGTNHFVRVYFNGSTTPTTSVSLSGVTINPGAAFVVASSALGGQAAFQLAYGRDADLYTTATFGNGNDVYSLELGSTVIDTYGQIGVDGTGQPWEYTKSYAYSLPNRAPNGGTFNPAHWFYGGVNALLGANDAERVAKLQQFTTPGTHNCGVLTPTGACCIAGVCSIRTQADCQAQGGQYQGNGTPCTPNPCTGLPCRTIAQAKALGPGVPVRLCEITVSSIVDLIQSATSKNFHAQDATGGITIFGSNAAIDALLAQCTLGDKITLEGTTGQFNGLFQLVAPFTFITNHGYVGVPTPVLVTPADFADGSPTAEGLESMLVQANCVTFLDGGGTFAMGNYTVVNEIGQSIVVRVSATHLDLIGQPIPTQPVNVRGIFSQYDTTPPFDGGYQLLVRGMADLIPNPACPPPRGACCIGGNCHQLSQAQCAAQGGSFRGIGQPCFPGICQTFNPSCLIISEVVDGTLSGGNPKFIEITNTGNDDYTFTAGGIIIQSNYDCDYTVDVSLVGVTIGGGESLVVATSASGGQTIFEQVYGWPAHVYSPAGFGNGNDRYLLTDAADGSNIIDIYGQNCTEGTGTEWEYTDGYSFRLPSFNSPSGVVFRSNQWFYGGPGSLEAPTDPERIALLLTYTTPGFHWFDQFCQESQLTGACCVGTACSVTTRQACLGAGGQYRGNGTDCGGAPCACKTAWEARMLPLGTPVRLCDVIVSSTTDLVASGASKNFQVQDATAGLTIFGSNADIDALLAQCVAGDRISLQGVMISFSGLAELVGPFQFIANHGHVGVPTPIDVTAPDFADGSPTAEGLESKLVRVACVDFEATGTFAVGNYVARDAGGRALTVRVSTAELDLVGRPIPDGFVNVRGIFSQYDTTPPFDGGYQLLPRAMADITPCAPPCLEGDLNCDGAINAFDIECFVRAVVAGEAGWRACLGSTPPCGDFLCVVDINEDGMVNAFDIDPFVQCVVTGQCP